MGHLPKYFWVSEYVLACMHTCVDQGKSQINSKLGTQLVFFKLIKDGVPLFYCAKEQFKESPELIDIPAYGECAGMGLS